MVHIPDPRFLSKCCLGGRVLLTESVILASGPTGGRWTRGGRDGVSRVFVVIAVTCAVALLLLGVPRLAAAVLRLPGSQAVGLAVAGQALRIESHDRATAGHERSAAWYTDRRGLLEMGFVNFNRGSQARAGSPEQAMLFDESLAALHHSLALSPAQPVAWLLVAGIHHERGARLNAARALAWTVRTGGYLARQNRTRTIIGLAVWDLLDATTRRHLLDSVRDTLRREPELVAQAVLAAALEDELEACLRRLSPDGPHLADRLSGAVQALRESQGQEPVALTGRNASCRAGRGARDRAGTAAAPARHAGG
jgi:hypothetical protein